MKLENEIVLFSASVMLLLLSMVLPTTYGVSVATDNVQSVYDVAGSGLNGIGQRYSRISDGAEISSFAFYPKIFLFIRVPL